jgi:laminin alpha 1/2
VCELKSDDEYICTNCPVGHVGDHCEKCEDGFYGNPLEIDSQCLPCACNGDPCDQKTGKCIKCEGNTEGWRCEKCKKGFYGDASSGCKICECSDYGGAINNVCDPTDGKCSCKPNYAGRLCDQCEIGYANISLNCAPCECNVFGSSSQICDRISGQCACKFNAKGLKCDTCDEEFYGLDAEQENCEGKLTPIYFNLIIIISSSIKKRLCNSNCTSCTYSDSCARYLLLFAY